MKVLALCIYAVIIAIITPGLLAQTDPQTDAQTDAQTEEPTENPITTASTPEQTPYVVENVVSTFSSTVQPPSTIPPKKEPVDRCPLFRPHPERLDRARYQMLSQNIWHDFICVGALIWDQIECACNWPRFILSSPCAGYRSYPDNPQMYQQWSNGVWFTMPCNGPGSNLNLIWYQERCWCDNPPFDPTASTGPTTPTTPPTCLVMLDATFDRGIFEDGPNVYTVGRVPWHGISPVDGTAVVVNAMLIVWGFKNNDLTDAFNIRMRFKPDADSPNRDKVVGLVANRCAWGPSSLEIGFNQIERVYSVTINTGAIETFSCHDASPQHPSGWIQMEFQFTKGSIMLTVNGRLCINAMVLGVKPAVSGCAMTFGGDELSAGFANMYGRFDRILIRKICPDPEPWSDGR